MSTSIVIAMTLAGLVGVALGLLGGGGSILTVPIFTLVLGIGTKEAIVSSLFVVAVTSAVSVASRVGRREVRWKVAVVFAATGLIGGVAGGMVGQFLPEPVLTVLFAAIMIVTAIAMMSPRREIAEPPQTRTAIRGIRTAGTGLGVGVLTGALGVLTGVVDRGSHSSPLWTGLAFTGGSPTSWMVWPLQAVMVTAACPMRDTANHRIASRRRHHPTRYHRPLVEAKTTGSTSRAVVVPPRDV